MQAIRDEKSLAVFNKCEPEVIHGPYRLVKFARFLLDHYYPVYMRLCQGQGVILSDYPVNTPSSAELAQTLAALNHRSEAFARGFYGYQ